MSFCCRRQCIFGSVAVISFGPQREKTCTWGLANNKGADKPVHMRRLITAFVIRDLESIIHKLDAFQI